MKRNNNYFINSAKVNLPAKLQFEYAKIVNVDEVIIYIILKFLVKLFLNLKFVTSS